MRKFIIFLLAFIISSMFAPYSKAQLNITASVEKKPEKVMTMVLAYSYVYQLGNGAYEFWAKTDNQFDNGFTTLFLGDSPETVLQTLKDLRYLMDNEIAAVNVQQERGDIVITYANQLGEKILWLNQDGKAGRSWISKQQVNKLITYFSGLLPKSEDQ